MEIYLNFHPRRSKKLTERKTICFSTNKKHMTKPVFNSEFSGYIVLNKITVNIYLFTTFVIVLQFSKNISHLRNE